MDGKFVSNSFSNKIRYNLPKPGEGRYFYGTDLEKIYNKVGDADIFSINANELSKEIEEIQFDIEYMQNNISAWYGDASEEEIKSIRTIGDAFRKIIETIKEELEPKCLIIKEFKICMNSLREKENELIELGINPKKLCEIVNSTSTYTSLFYARVIKLKKEMDDLLITCSNLYEQIKQFEDELEPLDFIIDPDYRGILDDDDKFESLPLLTQYLILVGDYGSYQGAPMFLMDYIPKLYGKNYKDLLDENGFFPAGYGILADKYNDMVKVMHEYYIYNQDEIELCTKQMAYSGCGYAAITNIVFDYYKDDPILFETVFGYPMYHVDEQNNKIYNYEAALIESYLLANGNKFEALYGTDTDRCILPTELGIGLETFLSLNDQFLMGDLINNEFDFTNVLMVPDVDFKMTATLDNGMSFEKGFDWINDFPFLEKNDVFFTKEGAIKVYQEYMVDYDYDYACIGLYDYELTPVGGNITTDTIKIVDGGHWMEIKGISENGNFIVSSWGREFELTDYNVVDNNTHVYPDGSLIVSQNAGIVFIKTGDCLKK